MIDKPGFMRVLKSVAIDFYQVHPVYGVHTTVSRAVNGWPASSTVPVAEGSHFMSATELSGGGLKTFVFDDPIFMDDDAYSIIVAGEAPWALNAIAEVAAGRDMRVKIATLGHEERTTHKIVGSNPFEAGVFFKSLTGITWEQDPISDMKFRATFNTYAVDTEEIVYMMPVDCTNVTAFICNWGSKKYANTRIVFEYRTQNGVWIEFVPFQLTYLNEITTTLHLRARMSTSDPRVTPQIDLQAGILFQSHLTSLKVLTRNLEVAEADICDIWLDSHLPEGCTQAIKLTFDDGDTFIDLANNDDGAPTGNLIEYSPVDLNVINVKYRHHWKVSLTPPNIFTNMRVEINAAATGPNAKLKDPRFSKLIMIASSS